MQHEDVARQFVELLLPGVLRAPGGHHSDFPIEAPSQLREQIEVDAVGSAQFEMRDNQQRPRALFLQRVGNGCRGGKFRCRSLSALNLREPAAPKLGITRADLPLQPLALRANLQVWKSFQMSLVAPVPAQRLRDRVAPITAIRRPQPEVPVLEARAERLVKPADGPGRPRPPPGSCPPNNRLPPPAAGRPSPRAPGGPSHQPRRWPGQPQSA